MGIPLVHGSVLETYIETEATYLLLMVSLFTVLSVSFLYLTRAPISVFIVYAIIGALISHTPFWVQ